MRRNKRTSRVYKKRNYNKTGKSYTLVLIIVGALALTSLTTAWLWHRKQTKDIIKPEESTPQSSHIDSTQLDSIHPSNYPDENDFEEIEEGPFKYKAREEYVYSVSEKEDKVDKLYFENTLFIGDSFVWGIDTYIVPVLPTIGVAYWNGEEEVVAPEHSDDEDLEGENPEEEVGLEKFLSETKAKYPSAEKIYLSFGTQMLSIGEEDFLKQYLEFIIALKKTYPNTPIYLQGIMPVYEEYVNLEKFDYLNNQQIDKVNLSIMNLAVNQGVYYLDTPNAVLDSVGGFSHFNTIDGVNMYGSAYFKWLEYIKRHTA